MVAAVAALGVANGARAVAKPCATHLAWTVHPMPSPQSLSLRFVTPTCISTVRIRKGATWLSYDANGGPQRSVVSCLHGEN